MTTLHPKDLHPVYHSVTYDEAIAIANLGAQVYEATKAGLFDLWNAGQTAEEVVKADLLRREGGQSMLDSLKKQLAAGEAAVARAAALQASIDEQVGQRVLEVLDTHRKDFELAKMAEMSALKAKIASAEGKEKGFTMIEEAHATMKCTIAAQATQLEELKALLEEKKAAATKSSHAIGKAGEISVLDLLENTVCKVFSHSSVKNMAGIAHVADFHLYVMDAAGQKVKILIDSKKYTNSVNSDEIKKLYSDMDADEECRCGIMISISSGICTKNQFAISRSLKRKPVLFLTFVDLSTEAQKDILCWGVQVLTELVGEINTESQQEMIENIDKFLNTITRSIKDIESVIGTQLRAVESMREVRGRLLKDMARFRAGRLEEEEDVPETVKTGCVTILKTTGSPCGRSVIDKSDKCRQHTTRVAKTKIQHC
jgi:hypothetical protein